jgi:hypothetical protein
MTKTADLQSIIVLGIDGHLRSNQVGRKIDHGAISPAQSMSFEGSLVFAQKQLGLAEKVYAVYEAGPLGYVHEPSLSCRQGDPRPQTSC